MPSIILFKSTTMAADVAKAADNPKYFAVPPDLEYTVALEVGESDYKVLSKDPLLHQEVLDAAQVKYKELVAVLGDAFKEANRLMKEKPQQATETFVTMANAIQAQTEKYLMEAEKAATKVWEELKKTKKEYTKYKVGVGAKIVLGVGGIVTSIALMASSPFTAGAGAVISIIGLAKSSIALGKQIAIACEEVETTIANFLHKLKSVLANADPKKGKVGDAKLILKEITGQVSEAVIGVSLVTTLKETEEEFDTAGKKLKGVVVGVHELAVTLNSTLEKTEKLKEVAKEVAARNSLIPSVRLL